MTVARLRSDGLGHANLRHSPGVYKTCTLIGGLTKRLPAVTARIDPSVPKGARTHPGAVDVNNELRYWLMHKDRGRLATPLDKAKLAALVEIACDAYSAAPTPASRRVYLEERLGTAVLNPDQGEIYDLADRMWLHLDIHVGASAKVPLSV